MNLWGKQWLGFLGIILFLSSCEKENEIGEPLNPNGDDVGVFYAEVPVTTSVILFDSVNTGSKFYVGKYNDPDFGVLRSQAFSQFLPEKANIAIPENVAIDSIVLTLRLDYYHGSNFNLPSTIIAHILSDSIKNRTHLAFYSTAFELDQVGFKTFTINPNTDTLLKVNLAPDEVYLNQLIENTRNFKGDTESVSNFKKAVKGLALVPDEDNNLVFGFDLYHSNSRITMYYHNQADSVISFDYRFGSSVNRWFGEGYSNITTDRSQTPLAGIESRTEFFPADNMVYLQPGTGLLPKINIDNIKPFVENAGNMIINRADLVIGSVQPFSKFLEPPSAISLFFTNDSNEISYVRSQSAQGNVPFAVTLPGVDPANPIEARISNESYQLQLTDILEAYYLDKIPYNQFLVHPKWIGSPASLKQAKIPADNIKLKIYYTKLK
ncbi:MAG: DUF4270 domain-containing protein [Bacteroidota bacterium]|nr:DUF4270 domain-containing protein [Bacteroidota bacterium]